jgi:hypothetical protein
MPVYCAKSALFVFTYYFQMLVYAMNLHVEPFVNFDFLLVLQLINCHQSQTSQYLYCIASYHQLDLLQDDF